MKWNVESMIHVFSLWASALCSSSFASSSLLCSLDLSYNSHNFVTIYITNTKHRLVYGPPQIYMTTAKAFDPIARSQTAWWESIYIMAKLLRVLINGHNKHLLHWVKLVLIWLFYFPKKKTETIQSPFFLSFYHVCRNSSMNLCDFIDSLLFYFYSQ